MTLKEAISIADEAKRNTFSDEAKRRWVQDIEQTIWREVITTHEGEAGEMPVFTEDDGDTELIAPDPYSALYPRYIVMKIDEATQEVGKFNNSMAVFSTYYDNYTSWYNRNYMPLGETKVNI